MLITNTSLNKNRQHDIYQGQVEYTHVEEIQTKKNKDIGTNKTIQGSRMQEGREEGAEQNKDWLIAVRMKQSLLVEQKSEEINL